MKDERAEMKIADKLASLDTLGAGMVYGREEAWDKLRARMDKKPLIMLVWPYGVAAAILLLVGVIGFYHAREQAVVNTLKPKAITAPIINEQQPMPPPATSLANVERHAGVSAPGPRRVIIAKQAPIDIKIETPAVTRVTAADKIETPAQLPEPMKPISVAASPMKVVHINDVERGRYGQPRPDAPSTGVALNKLPVVHITEVEREAVEVKELLKNNRMVLDHIPFTRHAYDQEYTPEEPTPHIQFLKPINTRN